MQGCKGTAVTWLPVRLSVRRICSTSRAGVHTRIPAGVSRLPGDAGHLATGTTSGGHLPIALRVRHAYGYPYQLEHPEFLPGQQNARAQARRNMLDRLCSPDYNSTPDDF